MERWVASARDVAVELCNLMNQSLVFVMLELVSNAAMETVKTTVRKHCVLWSYKLWLCLSFADSYLWVVPLLLILENLNFTLLLEIFGVKMLKYKHLILLVLGEQNYFMRLWFWD